MAQRDRKLLVIIVDGFAWRFLNGVNGVTLPGFKRLFSNGSMSLASWPAFPSNSFPNYYSLFAGCSVERHGMFGNTMFDSSRHEHFSMFDENYKPDFWFDHAPEPLWITAQNRGIETSLYYPFFIVPESKLSLGPASLVRPLRKFAEDKPHFSRKITDIVSHLKQPGDKFVVFYWSEFDEISHHYGTLAPETLTEMKHVDTFLGQVQDAFDREDLWSTTDVIVCSDHGMVDEVESGGVISIEKYLPQNFADEIQCSTELGPVRQVFPKPGRENHVLSTLKEANIPHVRVYARDEVPDDLRCKSAKFSPPILIVADLGYVVSYFDDVYQMKGIHGYDGRLPEMSGICIGRGKSFKPGSRTDYVRNEDVYLLMCHCLGLKANEPHDADFARIKPMLKQAA